MPGILSKSCAVALATALLLSTSLNAAFWKSQGERAMFEGTIMASTMSGFDQDNYDRSVKWLFASYEKHTRKSLSPGDKRLVGLKIYTNSGNGIQTPPALVRAVVAELKARGYADEEIFILDASESKLRETGYLPQLSVRHAEDLFDNIPVRYLDSNHWWSKTWFYDSPLPADYTSDVGLDILRQKVRPDSDETRKSYLAAALIEDVDFWINLPVVTDSASMEISGALANATLWNVSNRERFFNSSANAPVAMAEIAAIPELMDNWAMTLLSMEHYQVIGGPIFNSNYVRSDPVLLCSSDPAILDAWATRRLNAYRIIMGFKALTSPPFAVSFARLVGVGQSDSNTIFWITPTGEKQSRAIAEPDVVENAVLSKPRSDAGATIPKINPTGGRTSR